MMSEENWRRPNRLKGYDYSQGGAYFVTVCTQGHRAWFGHIEAAGSHPQHTVLSAVGQVVEEEIRGIGENRAHVDVGPYVIMPNHVHMIVKIVMPGTAPRVPLSEIVRLWKRAVSRRVGFSPWQKSFHDHIIRDQADFDRIAEYIANNPAQWIQDRYYVEAGENVSDLDE